MLKIGEPGDEAITILYWLCRNFDLDYESWKFCIFHYLHRVNLVVTEIVDAGLLGEYIIPTLRHTWKELLLPCKEDIETSNQSTPRGHVIPCGAVVHAMAIECPEIRRRSRLGELSYFYSKPLTMYNMHTDLSIVKLVV